MKPITVGIIGGGQLGQMLIQYGLDKLKGMVDYKVKVLNPTADCSCSNLRYNNVEIIVGSLHDELALADLCKDCDVITWEIEHINVDALLKFEKQGYNIVPNPSALKILQDKGTQKQFYERHKIPVVPYALSDSPITDFWNNEKKVNSLKAGVKSGVIYKLRCGGYDGKGVKFVRTGKQSKIENNLSNVLIEEYIENKKEIGVIVAIDKCGNVVTYDPVEMSFFTEGNILNYCSSTTDKDVIKESLQIAVKTAMSFNSPGLYAIEMFLYQENGIGKLVVNETSLRVHNSGHHTIHTHDISQFEMLARIILNLPMKQPMQLCNYFIMKNLYLADGNQEGPYTLHNCLGITDKNRGPFIVDYCKGIAKKWRKMGHVTYVGNTFEDVNNDYFFYNDVIQIRTDKLDLPLVGVVMGSESDWKIMTQACETLKEYNIPFETTVVSAHRTPERLTDYALNAKERGLRVIIAGAGGSAHLPGMIAAQTCLPVIGVPIQTSTLQGIDSLYSIVQMPPGVPVACMAINGAKNAAIFACQILGKYDTIEDQRQKTHKQVLRSAKLI